VVVYEEDQFGNLETGDNSTVVTVSLGSGTGPLSGTLSATVVGGVATFANLVDNKEETITLTFSSGSLTKATSTRIVVGNTTGDKLVVIQQPSSAATAGQVFGTQPVVEEVDQYGNVVASDSTSSVTAARGDEGTSTLLGNALTVTLVNGVATFSGLSYNKAESMDITFISSATGVKPVTSDPVVVSHTTPSQLVIEQQPSPTATAGQPFPTQPIVYEEDQFDNLVAGENSTVVTVALGSGTGPLSGTLTATVMGGVATFANLVDNKKETITLTFSSGNLTTATSNSIVVVPAPASKMVNTSAPLTLAAGSRGPITVQLEDPYGNLGAVSASDQAIGLTTTSAAGAFYANPSGGSAITVVTVPAGQSSSTFYYADTQEGMPTVTATAAALGSVHQKQTIDPAPASQVVITNSLLTLVAGSRGQVTVRLEDRYGNPGATSSDDQAIGLATTSPAGAFYSGASGGDPMTGVTIPAGQSSSTVHYSDTQAGTPTVTASDTAFPSSVNQVETVYPAAADHFVVTTSFASPDVAGTTGTVTVTAKDPYGNTAGSGPDQYAGTVDLSSTDSRASGVLPIYTFTAGDAGSHTFTGVVLETAGEQTITATDSGAPAHSGNNTVAVKAAAFKKLVVTTPPPSPMIAGQPFTIVVAAEDQYDNVSTSFSASMTLTLPGGGQTDSVQAKDGVATFTGLTVGLSANGGSIQVAGGGQTISTPRIIVDPPPPPPSPPTITGEQVVMLRKTNKKGKPVGKAVLQGFTLDFSTEMNAQAAGSSANYTVAFASTRRIKRKKVTVYTPVAFTPSYNAATHAVTLALAGKQTFAKGGEIMVIYSPPNGISGADGTPLSSSDATFTIQPKAKGITPD
jgi:hypothetical protein